MHIIIWEFIVPEPHQDEFISAYGSEGDWAKLFRRANGYLGTELLRSSDRSDLFITIDRWESATFFEQFQQKFSKEYRAMDERLESFTSSERKIGVFFRA